MLGMATDGVNPCRYAISVSRYTTWTMLASIKMTRISCGSVRKAAQKEKTVTHWIQMTFNINLKNPGTGYWRRV
ncbi:MAG: hypothetical protein KIT18_10690 [Burkholderiales bacterium]|nr:hypothetical protein [Burkholderiales bacterium]